MAAEVLPDLELEDLHGPAEQLHHGLHHPDQRHLVVAATVLVALLQAPVTVEACLVVVGLVHQDETCQEKGAPRGEGGEGH